MIGYKISSTDIPKYFFVIFIVLIPAINVFPTPEYAGKTKKECAYCHIDPSGGDELTARGKGYLLSLEGEKNIAAESEGQSVTSKDILRLVTFYLHIITAIFWFGTILYVHIILKPEYALKGLPRGEVRVGLFSMIVMALTGGILTYFKVPSIEFLLSTGFGNLLIIKVTLFLLMVTSALFTVFFIGPRLKAMKRKRSDKSKSGKNFTPGELSDFDGSNGNSSYIGYKGEIYDVSDSDMWEEGEHMNRHNAGKDLTKQLDQAPHGEKIISSLPKVGELQKEKSKGELSIYEKLFYTNAYLNMILVLIIILIITLWRL